MHTQTLISSILALAATLVATAPTSSDSSSLEKRFSFGYVGSYVNNDCSGDWIKLPANDHALRPKIYFNDCTPFTPQSGNIGINYGTGNNKFHVLTFYTDSSCTIKHPDPTLGTVYSPNAYGPGISCLHPNTSAAATAPGGTGMQVGVPGKIWLGGAGVAGVDGPQWS